MAPRVVILTTFDLDEYVFEALHTGAGGFLLKTAPADQLVAAVRTAVAGDALPFPPITRRLIEHCAQRPRPRAPDQGHRLDQLTARELDVLKLTVWFMLIGDQKLGNQAGSAFRSNRAFYN